LHNDKVMEIVREVELSDKLPDGAEVVNVTPFRVISSDDNHSCDRYLRLTGWTIKAVKYCTHKVVLLGSPDPGWYRFKPACVIPNKLSKEEKPCKDLALLLNRVFISEAIAPLHSQDESLNEKRVLIDKTYSIATHLIKNLIWPALVPSRQILAIIHKKDYLVEYASNTLFCEQLYTQYIAKRLIAERFIVSKYKTSNKLVVTKLNPEINKPLYSWNLGTANAEEIEEFIANKRNRYVIWLEDGVNFTQLVNDIKLTCTLKSI